MSESLPLIDINRGVLDIMMGCFVGFLVLAFIIFLYGMSKSHFPERVDTVLIVIGVLAVLTLFSAFGFNLVENHSVKNDREAAIELALGVVILDGDVGRDDSLLLLESADGELTRMAFNVNFDAGVMLLTPVSGGAK